MAKPDTGYNALTNDGNPFLEMQSPVDGNGTDTENEETPQNSGIMIHVVPETGKSRWNHVEDLDTFFSRMYCYHQKHGFHVMMLQKFLALIQFAFVVLFLVFLLNCVKYPVLFREVELNKTKITLNDAIIRTGECVASIHFFTWIVLILAFIFWIFRIIKFIYHFVQYWDIKSFFNVALKIDDNELDNVTWHEVQRRVIEVQSEQQMCIHKEQLTELDIYHRILRFKNYMVAMMNKNLLPAKVWLPIIGECVVFSRGLRYNIELILLWGPLSPFENNWHLREEFKKGNRRKELADKLSKQILWVAIANLILCPLIFLWQLMYLFFNYAEIIKREPSILGARCWSQYGRLYFRHFNELDHELNARISRAYRPACKYMNSFSSPLMAVIAKNVVFICGGVVSVLILLSVYDEDVLQVEHVLTIITILGSIVVMFRVFIPDDNLIWCPEQLITAVLAHVHYLPVSWRSNAHTNRVRDQFGQLFQLKAIYIINELFSPFVTPFVLCCSLRQRSLDIVDFFRNFTVSVVGVGDVCSFAQMDVRKHGNPDWHLAQSGDDMMTEGLPIPCDTNQYTQGEHGKTELSLVHFTLTNPQWKMPPEARTFVHGIRKHAMQDFNKVKAPFGGLLNNTAMGNSLVSVGSMGGEYSSIVQSILQTHNLTNSAMGISIFHNSQNYGNYEAAAPQRNPVVQQSQHNIPATGPATHAFDFERMLQQNLTDGSTAPLRSQFLHDIDENELENEQNQYGIGDTSQVYVRHPDIRSRSTTAISGGITNSLRGGMRNREGPIEGQADGLLHSLCGFTVKTDLPPEFSTADMCLSTLYLHEIHSRQIRRRGIHLEQSQRHLWQRPHQQQPQSFGSSHHQFGVPPQPSTSAGISSPSQQSTAVEKTPLLSSKKS